jgi:hypothetical protein
MKQHKHMKKLVLETERIKLLDSHRLANVIGGVMEAATYRCGTSTMNTTGR